MSGQYPSPPGCASWADSWALLAGIVLIGWILLQVVVLRTFSFFQPTYLLVGAYFVLASGRTRVGGIAEASRPDR